MIEQIHDTEQVILVDRDDRDIGVAGKLDAHVQGRLHRAVSVVVLDQHDRLLLQRRALSKYHSAGLWTNTCCGHPRPGETTETAAKRRLMEEMGLTCELRELGAIMYRAVLPEQLIEHEIDHVFLGNCEHNPNPAAAEVCEWRWQARSELREDLLCRAHLYTAWLPLLLRKIDAVLTSKV